MHVTIHFAIIPFFVTVNVFTIFMIGFDDKAYIIANGTIQGMITVTVISRNNYRKLPMAPVVYSSSLHKANDGSKKV